MPARRTRLSPTDDLTVGLDALRAEQHVPTGFPAEVAAEAAAAAKRAAPAERVDIPFVTIDPPGSKDLDQALWIERVGAGHRVFYAIADVGAWVTPGGPLDQDTHTRAVTVYAPDRRTPLHPPVLSEGAASLLPGEWRPAVLWTLELDGAGELTGTHVERRTVRSTAQHTYADVPAALAGLLQEVGEGRLAIQTARGGVQLAVPEQEVELTADGWTVAYRRPEPSEDWNAQVSLLTGIAAAQLMLDARVGILRTQPAPEAKALERLRRQAWALSVPWPAEQSYAAFIAGLDPAAPAHAALLREATGVGHGAGYTAFDGELPASPEHFALATTYAHATAPLRRMQDRYVSECCLAACAGTPVPGWVRSALGQLAGEMSAGTHRANAVERGVIDLAEALVLKDRVGQTFAGVVVDDRLVQLADPAVRAKIDGPCPEPGAEVTVRLERADPATRTVTFTVA